MRVLFFLFFLFVPHASGQPKCAPFLAAGDSIPLKAVVEAYRQLVGAPDVPSSLLRALAESASPFELSDQGPSEQTVLREALLQVQVALGTKAESPALLRKLRQVLGELLGGRRQVARAEKRAMHGSILVSMHDFPVPFAIEDAALSANGEEAAFISAEDAKIGRWSRAGWVGRLTTFEDGKRYQVARSPFEPLFLAGPMEGKIWTYDATWTTPGTFDAPEMESFAFSPDGQYVAINTADGARVWRCDRAGVRPAGKTMKPLKMLMGEKVERFTGDGSHAVLRSPNPRVIRFAPVETKRGVENFINYGPRGQRLRSVGNLNQIDFDFNSVNNRVVVGHAYDPAIEIWDWKNEVKLLELETQTVGGGGYSRVTYSPDGKYVLAVTIGGQNALRLVVWDAETGAVAEILPLVDGLIDRILFSKDSRTVLTHDKGQDNAMPRARIWRFQPYEEEP